MKPTTRVNDGTIPFNYVFANGHELRHIEGRPLDVQIKAHQFIQAGGFYLVTVYTDGVVQLQAVMDDMVGTTHTMAVEHTANDPHLMGPAVDRLVIESVRRLEAVH